MTIKQYELIYKIIKTKYPCNVLLFGLGEDSYLWKSANKGSNTIFIENIKSWGDKFPDLDVEIVNYKTTVLDFTNNLNEEKLLLSLDLDNSTESMKLFKSFIERFDSQNIEEATTKSLLWFKKHLAKDIIEQLYRKQLRNDTMKIKLLTKKGEFDGDVFDKNNKKISLKQIKPGCKVRIIAECIGMYFVPNEFGMTWKAIEMHCVSFP